MATALEGAKSQYDVVADGKLVFSKQNEGRFPEEDEVLARRGWPDHLGSSRWRSSGPAS
jgi:hypothetical protein